MLILVEIGTHLYYSLMKMLLLLQSSDILRCPVQASSEVPVSKQGQFFCPVQLSTGLIKKEIHAIFEGNRSKLKKSLIKKTFFIENCDLVAVSYMGEGRIFKFKAQGPVGQQWLP